ncbi:hypothetical protein E4U38_005248 [Claviceps purpurea]|nr:hypothetical protein E4U38_005248 [Claviceps purpurea]KAG6147108.1 hypothetical protein E4U28_007688 [Claviceps purpurea]KAG6152165.1 hypothetical protein E4U11_007591 [Claviceps purpurea]KAG6235070.1 hypothetical protein E4U25_005272 [Claviceps purpurea]
MPEAGTFLDPTRPPIDFVQRRELLQPCPCVAYRFGSRSPQLKGAPRSSDTTQCLTLAAGVSSPREAPDGGYEFYRRREDGTKTVSGKIRSRHRRQHQHDADSSFKLKIPCSENSAFFHFGFTASL